MKKKYAFRVFNKNIEPSFLILGLVLFFNFHALSQQFLCESDIVILPKQLDQTYDKVDKLLEIPIAEDIIYVRTVVHNIFTTDKENLSDSQIEDLIDELNLLFSGQGIDTNYVDPMYRPNITDTKIQFCLAKTDPNGNATSGITNTSVDIPFLAIDYVKIDSLGGVPPWDIDNYFNIWIAPIGDTLVGYNRGTPRDNYFPLASFSDGGIFGAVVDIQHLVYANYGTPLVNILVHECGHCFGLMHTWGESFVDDKCLSDDMISDTPLCAESWECSLPNGDNTCIESDNDQIDNRSNFLNYGCMLMFTPEQATVMYNNLTQVGPPSALADDNCGQIVLSQKDVSDMLELTTFPNPNDGAFIVSINRNGINNKIKNTIRVYNLQGQLVTFEISDDDRGNVLISLSDDIANGVYVLAYKIDGEIITTKVLVTINKSF